MEVNATGNVEMNIEGSVDSIAVNAEAQVDLQVDGSVGNVDVNATAEIVVTGSSEEAIQLNISEEADGAKLESTVKVEVETNADIAITLSAGAEGSSVKSTDESKTVAVDNQTSEPVKVENADGSTKPVESGEATETFYDKDGNVISVATYEYYENGLLKTRVLHDSDGNYLWTIKYTYYNNGKVNTETKCDDKDNIDTVATYEYYENGANKVITRTDKDGKLQQKIEYNEAGKPFYSVAYKSNGDWCEEKYEYSSDGKITLLVYIEWNADGTGKIEEYAYKATGERCIVRKATVDEKGTITSEVYYDETGATIKQSGVRPDGSTWESTYEKGVLKSTISVLTDGSKILSENYQLVADVSTATKVTHYKLDGVTVNYTDYYHFVESGTYDTITRVDGDNNVSITHYDENRRVIRGEVTSQVVSQNASGGAITGTKTDTYDIGHLVRTVTRYETEQPDAVTGGAVSVIITKTVSYYPNEVPLELNTNVVTKDGG